MTRNPCPPCMIVTTEQPRVSEVIVTDPGIDDAFAILTGWAALKNPALVTTYGNGSTFQTGENLSTLHDFRINNLRNPHNKTESLLFSGADRPLHATKASIIDTEFIHGRNMMEGEKRGSTLITEKSGVIYERIKKEDGPKVDVFSFGAVTEIQDMLTNHQMEDKIGTITIMGGTIRAQGNTGLHQEANFRHDPEALIDVITIANEKKIPITIVPLDLTEKSRLQFTPSRAKTLIRNLKARGSTEIAKLLDKLVGEDSTYSTRYRSIEDVYDMEAKIVDETKYKGPPIHDLTALMVKLHPELFHISQYPLLVQPRVPNQEEDKVHHSDGVIGLPKKYMGKTGNVSIAMGLKKGASAKYWQIVENYLAEYYT